MDDTEKKPEESFWPYLFLRLKWALAVGLTWCVFFWLILGGYWVIKTAILGEKDTLGIFIVALMLTSAIWVLAFAQIRSHPNYRPIPAGKSLFSPRVIGIGALIVFIFLMAYGGSLTASAVSSLAGLASVSASIRFKAWFEKQGFSFDVVAENFDGGWFDPRTPLTIETLLPTSVKMAVTTVLSMTLMIMALGPPLLVYTWLT